MSTVPDAATASALLAALGARGVAVTLDGDTLRVRAPRGAVGACDRAALAEHRAGVVALLLAEAEYERLYRDKILPLGDARRAAMARGDHAEAAKLDAERGALAAGEYTAAGRRYLLLAGEDPCFEGEIPA